MSSVVTGAFGYIGKYIARHLLELGEPVTTVTTHPNKPNPFGGAVKAFPYNFDHPDELTDSLRGASTLYNTYWVRFDYGGATFHKAVQNTQTLFTCARDAGIQKIIHISVTNASSGSKLPYYAGKGLLEESLADSGLPYCVVRPTLVFGKEDILVNNIAWLLRKFPLFPIFGDGCYRLQPIFVEDLSRIAVSSAGEGKTGVIDAVGPQDFTFLEFVQLIASQIKPSARLIRMPPGVGIALGRLIGLAVRDVILTRDELQGLMDGMLTSPQAANGSTRFSDWISEHRNEVGLTYSSEFDRHFRYAGSAKK